MITDMPITRIDVTDMFSNANCQYHFGIITLDVLYHLHLNNSSYNINSYKKLAMLCL